MYPCHDWLMPSLLDYKLPQIIAHIQDHASVGVMYMLGPDLLKLAPSAYTVAQELERYKVQVLKVREAKLIYGRLDVEKFTKACLESMASHLVHDRPFSVFMFILCVRYPARANFRNGLTVVGWRFLGGILLSQPRFLGSTAMYARSRTLCCTSPN